MIRSVQRTRGAAVLETDGSIGDVHDVYFDDSEWKLRYYVIDTGKWLPGRKVLLPPGVIGKPRPGQAGLPVDLTRDQVRHSPDMDTERPISRQAEVSLYNYYGWMPYWIPLAPAAPIEPQGTAEERERSAEAGHMGGDPHLRSAKECIGYHVLARDGEIGHVEDFLFDDETAAIRWVVVDTRNWIPGKLVVISPSWITEIKWARSQVSVRVAKEEVRNSPEYSPTMAVDEAYEKAVFTYYGYPMP